MTGFHNSSWVAPLGCLGGRLVVLDLAIKVLLLHCSLAAVVDQAELHKQLATSACHELTLWAKASLYV